MGKIPRFTRDDIDVPVILSGAKDLYLCILIENSVLCVLLLLSLFP